MSTRAIVSLSGGMDSATVLAEALQRHRVPTAVSFEYGSKHGYWEVSEAKRLAEYYGVPHKIVDLTKVMKGFKSNLMASGGAIPEGHYEAQSMSQTVVPGRNIIFASILAGVAWSNECSEIWMGVHAGDHAIYPDCRPAFVEAMNEAIIQGTDNKVRLVTPFLQTNKAHILKIGLQHRVPYHFTRTCYKNQPTACGKCGSCQERLEAFKINGVEDPLQYESRELVAK